MVNENFNCSKKDTGSTKNSKHECLDCANYKRKVHETEQTMSGRDVLIEMLQEEIKKVENLYKKSIDDYEKLRFIHCTTVQELSNLKEIHKKLKEDHAKLTNERESGKSQLYKLQTELEKWRNQYTALENKFSLLDIECCMQPSVDKAHSSHKSIIKEVMNIESIIQNQNQTLKGLLCKLLDEVKGSKHKESLIEIEEKMQKFILSKNDKEIVKSKSSKELITIIEELNRQIEKLNNFVTKLKSENDTIKIQLTEKISNLSTCLCVLERNHFNINNLSENIESIINEKEHYIQEIKHLKEVIGENNKQFKIKDQEICELKCKLDYISQEAETEKLREENLQLQTQLNEYKQNNAQVQKEYLEKEETCNASKCKLVDDIKRIEENNNALNDILVILTNENKSNLEKIADLNRNLKETNLEFEKCECKLKQKISELEEEIENSKMKLKSFQEQQQCQVSCKKVAIEEEIVQLKSKIKTLEEELKQLTLENTEYEEENKFYCQNIDNLMSQLRILEKEKLKVDEDNEEYRKRIGDLQREYEDLNHLNEIENKQLKEEINELKKNQEEFCNCKEENEDLKNKTSLTEARLKNLDELKVKIENENRDLMTKVNNLQTELTDIHEKNEHQILHLEEKIDELEHQQMNRIEQLSNCCDEINNIKKIAEDQKLLNDSYLSQMRNLETQKALLEKEKIKLGNEIKQKIEEIASLKSSIDEYEQRIQGCNCNEIEIKYENDMNEMKYINEKLQTEIETLGTEICRRQCMIKHLEQCVEKSNNILEECEKELKEIHTENENLRNDTDVLKTNLKKFVYEAEISKAETISLQDKLTQILRLNQQLELEKSELSNSDQKMKNEIADMTEKLDKLLKESKEKDEELEKLGKQFEFLRKSSEIYKTEYEKIKKTYTEIKLLMSDQIKKYNTETENLNKENIEIKLSCKSEIKSRLCLDKHIKDMELKMMEKEMLIKRLQNRMEDSSYEISQLKEYMHKVISDNKTLKDAINNLLSTLVDKLKNLSDSGEDVAYSSAGLIMQEILGSLVDLEKRITRSSNSCPMEQCNCMSVIMSQYNTDKDIDLTPVLQNAARPVLQNVTSHNSTGLTLEKKYDNVNIGRSSEILNICSDCCPEVEKVRSDTTKLTSDCCGFDYTVECEEEPKQKYPIIVHKPAKAKDEPFIIETDDSDE